jgi:AcrR family transcriptional regulator
MGAETVPPEAPAPAGGRGWSDEREQEVLDAALAVLVEEGFGTMTVERVAARAGASKASLYRRWRNKAELVTDAIRCSQAASRFLPPDTGDLRADLTAYLRHMQESFESADGALMTALIAERVRHPDLADEFDRRFVAEKRGHLHELLQRAIDRGELDAGTDIDILADLGPALMLYRFTLRRGQLRPDLAERIVDQLLSRS